VAFALRAHGTQGTCLLLPRLSLLSAPCGCNLLLSPTSINQVGISYVGTRAHLRGTLNDVECIKYCLINRWGVPARQIQQLRRTGRPAGGRGRARAARAASKRTCWLGGAELVSGFVDSTTWICSCSGLLCLRFLGLHALSAAGQLRGFTWPRSGLGQLISSTGERRPAALQACFEFDINNDLGSGSLFRTGTPRSRPLGAPLLHAYWITGLGSPSLRSWSCGTVSSGQCACHAAMPAPQSSNLRPLCRAAM
jgi:hypothetical protein